MRRILTALIIVYFIFLGNMFVKEAQSCTIRFVNCLELSTTDDWFSTMHVCIFKGNDWVHLAAQNDAMMLVGANDLTQNTLQLSCSHSDCDIYIQPGQAPSLLDGCNANFHLDNFCSASLILYRFNGNFNGVASTDPNAQCDILCTNFSPEFAAGFGFCN